MKNLLLKICMPISIFFGCLSPAFSQTSLGAVDCEKWLIKNSVYEKIWLVGFMSGLNFMHELNNRGGDDPLGQVKSSEKIFLWMDNYCKTNPTQSLKNGGVDLYIELMKQQTNTK